MESILALCELYEHDLLNHTARWTKDRARQISAVRQLARWHHTAYGSTLLITDLTPDVLFRHREHCLKRSSPNAYNRRRDRLRAFGRWLVGSGRAAENPFDPIPAMPTQLR